LVVWRGGCVGGCRGFGATDVVEWAWWCRAVDGCGAVAAVDASVDGSAGAKDGSGTEETAGSAAAGVGSGWAKRTPKSADAAVAAPAASQVVDRIRLRVCANGSGSPSAGEGRVTRPSLDGDLWRFLRITPGLRRLTASSVTM
jgi:hypothetical protein